MNVWPYTNFHELNLDWILSKIREMQETLDVFVNVNTIKYADPIKWDITKQYEANTVVVDEQGTAYLSVTAVPAGISITRDEYWTEIGNFSQLWVSFKAGITPYDEGASTTATRNYSVNDLVWVSDDLYIVTKAMTAGDKFTSANSTVTSINAEIAKLRASMANYEQGLDDLNTKIDEKIAKETAERNTAITDTMNLTNVLALGVKLDDSSAAATNTAIINNALKNGAVLFVPRGTVYINAPLVMYNLSGIVGYSADECLIEQTAETDGIQIPVTYDPKNPTKVETCVRLENIRLHGTTAGIGLKLYNYTYSVTCGRDNEKYRDYKGDAYGLEYRNSAFYNIQISEFATGLECDTRVGVIKMVNVFIDTCHQYGFSDKSSDSDFIGVSVTYCQLDGVTASEALSNRYTNCKIYQNGKRSGNGMTLYKCRNMQLTAVDVEENKNIGAQLLECSECHVDIMATSNGFGNTGSDTYQKSGVIMSNCKNITGSIIACDKNAGYFSETATQSYGFHSDTVVGQIQYAELANSVAYNDWDDISKRCTVIADDTITGACIGATDVNTLESYPNYCTYSNNMMYVQAKVSTTAQIPGGNWLLDLTASLPALTTAVKRTFAKKTSVFTGVATGSDGVAYPVRLTIGESVTALIVIPSGIELTIYFAVPYSYI